MAGHLFFSMAGRVPATNDDLDICRVNSEIQSKRIMIFKKTSIEIEKGNRRMFSPNANHFNQNVYKKLFEQFHFLLRLVLR